MICRILFPTDFSHGADKARALAIELATKHGASVDILHAIEPIVWGDDDHSFDDFYKRLEKNADTVLARTAGIFHEAKVPHTTRVVLEKRWRAIVEFAAREGTDLIVMGSRAPGLHANSIGTTSHKVFLTATVPVLIVR